MYNITKWVPILKISLKNFANLVKFFLEIYIRDWWTLSVLIF